MPRRPSTALGQDGAAARKAWDKAANSELATRLPAGLGAILISVINGLLDTPTKARLVFWRWHDPLPGSRAFSQYVELDPRIDVAALKSKLGPFPTKPAEQNALWYKLYKTVEADPRVLNVHRLFLLTRDYAGIAFMLLILFGAIGVFAMQTYRTELFYVGALLVQFIASAVAARNYGIRFVNTVLALKRPNKPRVKSGKRNSGDMRILLVFAIAVLVTAIVWPGSAVVRLENYHYANFVGLCTQFNIKDPRERIEREACLERTETRTNWAWHLVYGLKIL